MEHQIVCNQHCLIKRLELFIIADLTNIDKQNATQGERCRNIIRQLLSRAGALRKIIYLVWTIVFVTLFQTIDPLF